MKNIRKLVLTGIFSGIGFVLMLLDFPLPFLIPSFIKLDFSELPALICAFAAGPVWGVAVCLIKNLLHLLVTTTGGVGELANFLLGAAFVLPAGLFYRFRKTKTGALWGCLAGAALAALVSVPVNYFITYPFYMNFMPAEAILAAYQALLPSVNSLLQALVIFNMPFTFGKFAIDATVTFLIYKRLSPFLKGKKS